jgi:hypothetical protein
MDRLAQVMVLLERELARMDQAAQDDAEYTSLGGNGCNAFEAFGAFEPIVEKARAICAG